MHDGLGRCFAVARLRQWFPPLRLLIFLLAVQRPVAVCALERHLPAGRLERHASVPRRREFCGLHVELGALDVQAVLVQ